MRTLFVMGKPPAPPPRKTMEVDISWLEDHPEVQKTKAKTGKKPPRMPGAAVTVPPLPIAPSSPPVQAGRKTIEVELDWVELVDENGNVVKKPVEKK